MFRKILFWSHLGSGVIAGVVILMMSFTGAVLTFERQILAWAEQSDYVPEAEQSSRLSLEQLYFITRTEHGDFNPTALVIKNNPGAPVAFSDGRGGGLSLNPFSGEELQVGSPALEGFFSTTTGIHRRFNITGESRNTARAITGASNLLFLFLILGGLYLWFPKIWKWGMFKIRLVFRNTAGHSKARDFNWHHVFGLWSAFPLAVVVATATVSYYPWASNLVFQVYGEQIPVLGRGPAPAQGNNSTEVTARENAGSLPVREPVYQSIDNLVASAIDYIEANEGSWRQIGLAIPTNNSSTISFAIDRGNGGQPHLRHTLVLNRENGTVADWQPFSSQSPGRQTRSIIRYLHTGEVLGLWGQTIAGLVSLTSLFMVWTGLALAWGRLVQPLMRRKTTLL